MEVKGRPWWRHRFNAFLFGLHTSSLLFTSTIIPFAVVAFVLGNRTVPSLVIGSFPIAAAAVVFAVTTFFLPNLVSEREYEFPLNLTLPTVFCVLALLMSHFMASVRTPLALLGDDPRLDQAWKEPLVLGSAWIIEFLTLSFTAKRTKPKGEDQP